MDNKSDQYYKYDSEQYLKYETFSQNNNDERKFVTSKGYRTEKTKMKNYNFLEGKEYYKCIQFNSEDEYIMILSPKENLFKNQKIQSQNLNFKAIKEIKKLQIPQFTKLLDFGHTKDKSYIVTENIDFTLMEYVFQKDKTYNDQDVIELFQNLILQIGAGLVSLENYQIVLYNLEIENIGVKVDKQKDSNQTIFKIFDYSHAKKIEKGFQDQQGYQENLQTEFRVHTKNLGKILMDLYNKLVIQKNIPKVQQLIDLIKKIQENQIQSLKQIFEHPLMNMVLLTLIMMDKVHNVEKIIKQNYYEGIWDMVLQLFD